MTWRPRIESALAIRSLAVAVCAGLCDLSAAAGLTTILANGQTLSVIETSTPARVGYVFERRYPDGTRDRQFGAGGRVYFDMGGEGGAPSTVTSDALGNILVAGVTPLSDRTRGAVVLRFLSAGQLDSRWGDQGQVRLPVARGDGVATDVLPQSGGGLLVVGSVEDTGSKQASIWRVAATGQPDPSFGQRGVLLAAALPMSQALSIQQGPSDVLVLAIQTTQGGKTWLEMHRWQSGEAVPLRIARQELPEQWVGPASLVQRRGQWFWLDPSQPERPIAVATLARADSPWGLSVQQSMPPADAADLPGMAAMSPFVGAAINGRSEPAASANMTIWFAIAAATVLVAGAMIWRSRRY
jgi:uncharacterized delta-60 repeat protein